MTEVLAVDEPVAGRASGPLGAVQAADREISRQTALRARAIAAFAETRPASADRPRLALTDTLLALTDLPGLRRAARGLGAPAESPGYRPAAALDRFLRTRDRHCRFPGCRRPVPRHGELDHHTPWPAGPTAAGNLAGYCTGHHRSTAPSRVPP
ncbi:hypothetical protein ACI780_02995 [Geodermatophilus sp. SYSU D00814]